MTKDETRTILSICKAEWPQSFRGMRPQDGEAKFKLWCHMFADDDYELVCAAVKALIVGNREFAPGVGQIKAKMRELSSPQELSEAEAWNLVAKAIKNGLFGNVEEFAKLPPILKRIVGSPSQIRDWAMMDSEVVHSVVASNFMRSYRAISVKEQEYAALPGDIRDFVKALRLEQVPPPERPKLPERREAAAHTWEGTPMPDSVREKIREITSGSAGDAKSETRLSREETIAILRGEKPYPTQEDTRSPETETRARPRLSREEMIAILRGKRAETA